MVPVIEKLAMQEAVPMDRVLLSKTDGSPIEATDSPRSIGLNAVDFISKSTPLHRQDFCSRNYLKTMRIGREIDRLSDTLNNANRQGD